MTCSLLCVVLFQSIWCYLVLNHSMWFDIHKFKILAYGSDLVLVIINFNLVHSYHHFKYRQETFWRKWQSLEYHGLWKLYKREVSILSLEMWLRVLLVNIFVHYCPLLDYIECILIFEMDNVMVWSTLSWLLHRILARIDWHKNISELLVEPIVVQAKLGEVFKAQGIGIIFGNSITHELCQVFLRTFFHLDILCFFNLPILVKFVNLDSDIGVVKPIQFFVSGSNDQIEWLVEILHGLLAKPFCVNQFFTRVEGS